MAATESATDPRAAHSIHSVLRERIVEHVFVGEVMRSLWQRGIYDIEVLRAEFDTGGYDLVLSCGNVARYIQFKASMADGARTSVNVNMRLANAPSGCVIWIGVDTNLNFKWFRWLGNLPGEKLPDISDRPQGKHTKANAQGVKSIREDQRLVHKRDFERLEDLEDVLSLLFGIDGPQHHSS
jgi:hypothetical protein